MDIDKKVEEMTELFNKYKMIGTDRIRLRKLICEIKEFQIKSKSPSLS